MDGHIYGETHWDTEGPYREWQATATQLTSQMRDDFNEALRGRRHPACPNCLQPVETIEWASVSVQQHLHGAGAYEQVGTLTTLHPCKHRFAA